LGRGGNLLDKIDLFKDISKGTEGDVYLGVVGAVRTGKSMFIKRLMELVVLPNMKEEHENQRAKDELLQSATGRTIMTTEPKLVPKQALSGIMEEGFDVNLCMVYC